MGVLQWVVDNWQAVVAIATALLSVGISVAMLVPGSEPEGTLQKIVDVIAKFSRK